MITIVQKDPINRNFVFETLARENKTGAIVTFNGYVRDINSGVKKMFIEQYPGVTERAIKKIQEHAQQKWNINDSIVIHRVGELLLNDEIVLVAVSGEHRTETFRAAEFIIDYLKTEAPFWKKEFFENHANWVQAKDSDIKELKKWK
ncbi:MAG: molybdenum cofactor biosynthesis protein MoaE [Nitrosomonadales bacterium]